MKSNLFRILVVFLALGVATMTSCKKPDPDQQSAEDDARGGFMMADAFALGNDNAGDGGKAFLPEGMEVSTVGALGTGTTTITFTNCDYRGAVRNGVVKITYTRKTSFGDRAFSLMITFEDYTVDGVKLEGTITSTFGGTYAKPVISVKALNMVATFADDRTYSWSSNKTITIEEGFANPEVPNVIVVSGTVTGKNRASESFTSTYADVKVKRSCDTKYPVSGTVTIVSTKGSTIIDYGNGECDNDITITNGGITINVTLD